MTVGSRGDVAPYTGLGTGLLRAGHEVTLVTHGSFAPLVAGSGLGFHPLPVDPREEMRSGRVRGLHRSGTGVGKLARLAAAARSMTAPMAEALLEAARGHDVLLVSGALVPPGHAIAEGLGLPSMGVWLQPLAATREFGATMLGSPSLGPLGNRFTAHAVRRALEQVYTGMVPALRRELGLPRQGPGAAYRSRERRAWPVFHGFSPLVVPRPGDWRPGLEVAGYWWPYEVSTELPPELEAFLAAGPPPVFVGLGSATLPDPERVSALLVDALRRAGLRGVVQHGWAGLAANGDDMLTVGEVPHAALFPRVAAVVHHAGAGTTGAGLRAGVPAVPVPIQFDAGFWARRLVALGVAPDAVPLRRLSAGRLAAALTRAVNDPGYRDRAAALGARIRAEDGVAPVAAALKKLDG